MSAAGSGSWELYDWLASRAAGRSPLRRIVLGLQWTAAQVDGVGLCFSPGDVPRTLSWPGTLAGRDARELCSWLRSFDPAEACVGLASLNALVNTPDNPCVARAQPLADAGPGHLRVFAHFARELAGKNVVVVGRYPGLEASFRDVRYRCLERRAGSDALPDLAADYVLPEADWVFITASAIANKSLPHLLSLCRQARVVLMGPSLPWLAQWADFGVDYVAGVVVTDPERAFQIAAEGGGTRLFEGGVEYRLLRVS
jgi:uncharacterized protein (DUF4213/DUF364 family)